MPRNYHLVRATIDWPNATVVDINPDMRALVVKWEALTEISYFHCRTRIAAIAAANWSAISGLDAEVSLADLEATFFDPDDLLLISDDDDWYAPDIFSVLRSRLPFTAAIWPDAVWGVQAPAHRLTHSLHLEQPLVRPLSDTDVASVIKTNNYCVSGRYLAEHGAASVLTHEAALRSLTGASVDRCEFEQTLSVVNRHPCSVTVMNRYEQSGDGDFLKLVEAYRTALPNFQPAWAQPYAEQIVQLFTGGMPPSF